MKNEKSFDEASPIEKVWEEICDGTFLDGFTVTSGCHPLPPEILAKMSKLDDRPAAKGPDGTQL
jgi:hypothetical protein